MTKERSAPALGLALLGLAIGMASTAEAAGKTCAAVASAQGAACRSAVQADYAGARAICLNRTDAAERSACFAAAREERSEASAECREQRSARRDLCEELGGGPYDPPFDPAAFETVFASPNPYFPLSVGDRWSYAGEDETIEIEVRDETKAIEGVTCIVVVDRAEEEGQLVEDTDDWFAQAKDGAVHYCGEISRNFELFPGDDPLLPELVDVDGSWKAGRDGALSGTLFPAAPAVGQVYRQEFAPGVAEDAARVVSTTYGFGADAELDEHVPAALALLLCDGDCVVTEEFTPLEPDALERKYYAPGIGLFLDVAPEDAQVVRLVDCNVDPRCGSLPLP
jgi:hypothetical protein